MKARLLNANGSSRNVRPENGTDFSLKEMYRLIGCSTIELVFIDGDSQHYLIVDEDGTFKKDLELNVTASIMARRPIVGNALYINRKMLK